MSSVPFYIVDAFTTGNNDSFTGGPAAICFLKYDNEISDDVKVKLAKSLQDCPMTAFISHAWTEAEKSTINHGLISSNKLQRTIRWFTPGGVEVPLCGHATVASTKALAHSHNSNGSLERVEFRSKLQTLQVDITEKELITINLPKRSIGRVTRPWLPKFTRLLLGPAAAFENVGEAVQETLKWEHFLVIRLAKNKKESPSETLKKVKPDFEGILRFEQDEFQILVVTIQGDEDGADVYSRIFAPSHGVNEDPVCVVAHSLLVPYWAQELGKMSGDETHLDARQLSDRGGRLRGQVPDEETVRLSGTARVVLNGTLHI